MTNTLVRNILFTLDRGTPAEHRAGMEWYDSAHEIALEMSSDVWQAAGVIAAFSPRQEWSINVRNARKAFDAGTAIGHTPNLQVAAFCNLAERILKGEHTLDVLKGDKTRAFAAAIADPANSTIATIDRHAFDIAFGKVHTDKTRPSIGKRVYREYAQAYTDAASFTDMSVAQLQAATWVTWKRLKGHKVHA